MHDHGPDPKSHYFVQLNRRFSRLEAWREARRELARGSEVVVKRSPTRGLGVGMLVGEGSQVPMRMIDARILELAPGERSSTHRHLHDAILLVLDGHGETVIDGNPYEWDRWDALHTPSWSWHSHRNLDSERPARLLAVTDAPLLSALRLNRAEDVGMAERGFERSPSGLSREALESSRASAYEAELAAAEAGESEREDAVRHTRFANLTLRQSPRGTRTALLVDSSLGFRTSGLSMAMFQIPPGRAQAKHRHPGEAILYIVEGRGYSVIEDQRYEWGTGDAVVVHQYAWHQHFNSDPEAPAVVVRLHMWESIIDIMQAAMDPIPLYEDDPDMDREGGVWAQTTPEAAGPA